MSFLSLTIWVVESQAIVLPLVSVCLKDSLNFVMKSSKVPRERVVEVEVKASCWKVDAHVATDPLFIYIQEGKSDLLVIGVIDRFVDYEVEPYSI